MTASDRLTTQTGHRAILPKIQSSQKQTFPRWKFYVKKPRYEDSQTIAVPKRVEASLAVLEICHFKLRPPQPPDAITVDDGERFHVMLELRNPPQRPVWQVIVLAM
jgi:hypothetical protein